MEPTPELIDQLYREELEEARRMSGEQKPLAGGELFELASQITLAGIRAENPGLSEEELLEKFRERLRLARRLECIAVQQALDWPYIERWCDQHGTRDLLEQI